MKREELREKLREITTSKRVGFLYAVGNDDLLIDELENFIEQELSKAREEGYKKGYIDGQTEKINKPKPVMSEFDKTSYLN